MLGNFCCYFDSGEASSDDYDSASRFKALEGVLKSLRNLASDWTRAASRSWVNLVPRPLRSAIALPPLIAPSGSI